MLYQVCLCSFFACQSKFDDILRLEVLNDFEIGPRARLVFFELSKFGFVGRARQVRLLSFVLGKRL